MPLRGRLDIAIQLHTFRNIDLFQQGLYELRISLHHVLNSFVLPTQKVFARPTDIYKATHPSPTSHLCLCPPHIIDAYSAFCSRIMLIRYSEEEIQMHDIAAFTTDIDIDWELKSPPLMMEVELMFSDVLATEATTSATEELSPEKIMRNVSTAVYRINQPCTGVFEFLRVNFDDMHFASVTCTLHCVLTQCRFTSSQMQMTDLEAARMGMMRSAKPERQLTIPEIGKIIFPDGDAAKELIGSEETNRAYARYTLSFAKTLEQLHSLLTRFMENSSVMSMPLPRVLLPEASTFSDLLSSHACEKIVARILEMVTVVGQNARALYDLLLLAMQDHPWQIAHILKEQYQNRMIEQASDVIFREVHRDTDTISVFPDSFGNTRDTVARTRRVDPYFSTEIRGPIEDMLVFPDPSDRPILFDDAYVGEGCDVKTHSRNAYSMPVLTFPKRRKRHLVVLVHGFGGNAFDVRMLKNHITQEYPEIMVHSAHSNEDEGTNGDIIIMGRKLAAETLNFISEYFPKNALQRISFVGHSMGGLIIRAALPLLSDLKAKFHFYLSLSTPHLGYIQSSSRLVDMGLWILKKFNHSLSLDQLTMKDNQDLRNCTLYTLSEFPGLERFSHVLFFSSYQDAYAPYESARVQLSEEVANSPRFGVVYAEIVKNIISLIPPEALRRVEVNFNLDDVGLDHLIGRAAHIQFLENNGLLRTLMFGFPELFKGT